MSSVQPSFFRNTWLIAKREYVERIRAKSFIVMTVLIPTLMGGLTFAMNFATGKSAKSDVNLAIVTRLAHNFENEIAFLNSLVGNFKGVFEQFRCFR